ncbi:serine/threonine-protein kinase VRK1-like [Nilaparvata lugens]|uniref:serine/threonine-protein kinase VRK1-like n=1 Tax=Nilaparvata lugens TaxID=108931 RepID=UPI00193EBC69|nr:serine/threonine-protein kinase VRK1-like [Nilaparvata lugens]
MLHAYWIPPPRKIGYLTRKVCSDIRDLTLLSQIDALEFLHSHGYVHSNIKSDNIVLGLPNQAPVHLLDFGEARRYPQGDIPIAHRNASIGSSAFTSRDRHNRLITRRGDLEMLAYNVVHLLTGHLPWEDEMDYEEVARKENKSMEDVKSFLSTCFMHIGSRHPVITRCGNLEMVAYNIVHLLTGHLPWEDEMDYEEVARKENKSMEDVKSFLSTSLMPTCLLDPATQMDVKVKIKMV